MFCFPSVFLHVVLSATKFCIISYCFNQSHLLLLSLSLSVYGPTLTRSTSVFGPNSALKSLPMNCTFFLLEEVHAHQHYTLVAVCNQCYNGTFADVFCQKDISPSLVQWDSNSKFVLEFSSSHENVLWCVSQISALFGLHVSFMSIASHQYPSVSRISSSIRSLEFKDLVFFGKW